MDTNGAKTTDNPTWSETDQVLEFLDPKTLLDSPLQYRKDYPESMIDELAESITSAGGILENLLARPKGKRRELVFGHCRKRAAIKLGRKTVPVIVREMTDREVRIAQLAENGQRANPHPLEEMEGYKALLEQEQMSVGDVCAAVGKSPPYIYRRLALKNLCPAGRKALEAGKLRLGVAELIARLADHKAQADAVKALSPSYDGSPVTIATAKSRIERDHLRNLKQAPFDPSDSALVPAAGACTVCPKRSGANPDLFGELTGGANVCTDGACYGLKLAADWKVKSKEHESAGGTVLKAAEAKKVFPYSFSSSLGHECGYYDLDADRGYGRTSYRKELKAAGAELPPVVLARDPTGGTRQLVKKTDLDKSLRKAGGGGRDPDAYDRRPMTPAEKKDVQRRRRAAELDARTDRLVATALAVAPRADHLSDVGFWRTLAEAAIRRAWHDTCKATCARRGLEVPKGGSPEEVLLAHARAVANGEAQPDAMTGDDKQVRTTCELLAGLTLEVVTAAASSHTRIAEAACGFFGIKRGDLKKQAQAELTAERKEKDSLEKAKKTKKTKKTKKKTAAKAASA